MAIYHLTIKAIKRSKGQSVVAACAYRRATLLRNEQLGQDHDYRNKKGVIHSELSIPKKAPSWVNDLVKLHQSDPNLAVAQLWNKVESNEKRKDAQFAREIEFALPLELSQDQNIALAREFIEDQFALRGMIADWSVHWDQGNPHVHVLLTLRALTPEGFGLKVREWNKKDFMLEWRKQWAKYANFHLRQHGFEVRIDHRSYQEQGIDLKPGVHQGKAVNEMTRKGLETDTMLEANAIRRENLRRITEDPQRLLKKMEAESSTFSRDQFAQEVGRYLNDRNQFAGVGGTKHAESSVLTSEQLAGILKTIELHDSVFSERELARAVAPFTDQAEAFARMVMAVKQSEQVIALGPGDDGRERFTTRRMFELENQLQTTANQLGQQKSKRLGQRRINRALAQYQAKTGKILTAEQKQAVQHVLKSGAVSCIVGRAGTGKSFTLGAAKAVWDQAGMDVQGVALSGIAADGLRQEAGIDSRTIDSFRWALQHDQVRLTERSVVVMDEAGMTDTHAMLAMVKAVQEAKAQLVLVGDPAQIQPVGPGASFRALLERFGFAEIETVYRQKTAWQRDATVALSAGQVPDALAQYAARGAVHFDANADESIDHLVRDWRLSVDGGADLSQHLVIAHRNADVDRLNQRLRTTRVNAGELAEGYAVTTSRGVIHIAQGDRLLFLKNDRQLGVNNGRFATIQSVQMTETGQVLSFQVLLDGKDKAITLNPKEYNEFTYGYAATVHKVQGVTVDHSLVYVDGLGWNRHLAYVALSRHRHSTAVYTHQGTHRNLQQLVKQLGRHGIKDSVLDFPLAFAKRRGINSEPLHQKLSQRLAKRLAGFKARVGDRYQQWTDPVKYWEHKTQAAEASLAQDQLTHTREHARVVARYVDQHRAVGRAWGELNQELTQHGLTALPRNPKELNALINQELVYAYQHAVQARDQLAATLWKNPAQYLKAIQLYGLDLQAIRKQAQRHQCVTRVEQYHTLLKANNTVLRDRAAAAIMMNIKAHYPHLKAQSIDTQLLRQQAMQHQRRLVTLQLTPQERHALKQVEQYRKLSQQLGRAYQASQTSSDTASQHLTITHLAKSREAVAHAIMDSLPQAAKALDFYQIGLALPQWNQTPTQQAQQLAEQRFEKLQQAANRHHYRERVMAYVAASKAQQDGEQQRLAHLITTDPKAHHGAIVQQGVIPAELWRSIRADAKTFARNRLLNSLSLDQQADFKQVEDYVNENRACGKAWAEVFAAKEHGLLSAQAIQTQLIPLAQAPQRARDKLAALIQAEPDRFKVGLEFYQVKPERLNLAAERGHCIERVKAYVREQNTWTKAQLAHEITENPKSHYAALIDAKVDWQQLYALSQHVKQHNQFATYSREEKRLVRLTRRYKAMNQHAGRTWSQIITAEKEGKSHHSKRKQAAWALSTKRDDLAAQLLTLHQSTSWPGVINSSFKRLNQQKLTQHASQHQIRLNEIKTWQLTGDVRLQGKISRQLPSYRISLLKTGVNPSTVELKPTRLQTNQGLPTKTHTTPEKDWHYGELKEALVTNYEAVYHAVLGESKRRQGNGVRYGRHGSLSVTDRGEHAGQWYSFETGEGGGPLELLMSPTHGYGLSFNEAMETAAQMIGLTSGQSIHINPAPKPQQEIVNETEQLKRRIDTARRLINQSIPIAGTLGERYLREHRGIQGDLSAFRFLEAAKDSYQSKVTYPAVVLEARNEMGEITGMQQILLDPKTGKKATGAQVIKRSHGVLKGSAACLRQTDSQEVWIAEGPETAATLMMARPEAAVYVTLGNIANAAHLGWLARKHQTQQLNFAADNDGPTSPSQKALHKAAQQLEAQGITCQHALPVLSREHTKVDFNDVLQQEGLQEVQKQLASLTPFTAHVSREPQQSTLQSILHHPEWQQLNTSTIKTDSPTWMASQIHKVILSNDLQTRKGQSLLRKLTHRFNAMLGIDEHRKILKEKTPQLFELVHQSITVLNNQHNPKQARQLELLHHPEWNKLTQSAGLHSEDSLKLLLQNRALLLTNTANQPRTERLMPNLIELLNDCLDSSKERSELQQLAPNLYQMIGQHLDPLARQYGVKLEWPWSKQSPFDKVRLEDIQKELFNHPEWSNLKQGHGQAFKDITDLVLTTQQRLASKPTSTNELLLSTATELLGDLLDSSSHRAEFKRVAPKLYQTARRHYKVLSRAYECGLEKELEREL